jgi:hypothetical protein
MMPNNSFDDMKKSVTGLFQRSVKGVDQLAESIDSRADMVRMAAQIRSLKRKREDIIAQIGRKTYTLHTRGKVENTDILGDCKQVDVIGKQIEGLQSQIEELRKGPADKPPVVALKDETPLPADEPAPAPAVTAAPEPALTSAPEPEPPAPQAEPAAPEPPAEAPAAQGDAPVDDQ